MMNIGKSADASAESAKNILELQERARRIDKIVDAIVMVTVQTKCLPSTATWKRRAPENMAGLLGGGRRHSLLSE